eukprot:12700477-Alexandrium_andersonii.AAC.1
MLSKGAVMQQPEGARPGSLDSSEARAAPSARPPRPRPTRAGGGRRWSSAGPGPPPRGRQAPAADPAAVGGRLPGRWHRAPRARCRRCSKCAQPGAGRATAYRRGCKALRSEGDCSAAGSGSGRGCPSQAFWTSLSQASTGILDSVLAQTCAS